MNFTFSLPVHGKSNDQQHKEIQEVEKVWFFSLKSFMTQNTRETKAFAFQVSWWV